MPSRPTTFIEEEYYHLYNRGNSKQVIFHDEQDHKYFMHLILIMNNDKRIKTRGYKDGVDEGKLISIGAFCLMPNHFHFLVRQEKEGGISLFMQKLLTGYVGYYNQKYKRAGALFEGRFKSKHAGEDSYLKYLFSYIHLNPLKILDKSWRSTRLEEKDLNFLLKYQYSSFNEYVKDRFEYIEKDAFPNYFPTKSSFLKEITSWLRIETEQN